MISTRAIPVLLIKNKGLVKTVKFSKPKYVGDPINAVKIFNDKGADELVLLDIMATKENKEPNYARLQDIASECFMPLAYGGGIRTIDQAKRIIALGCEKTIINTCAIENPSFVAEVSKVIGSQSVVICIDVKRNILGKYQVWSHGGSKNTGIDPLSFAKRMEQNGAGEILLNSIDRDGTLKGYDIDLIKLISSNISIPVIACGGAGQIEDFGKAVNHGGASAVAAGSLFVFHGPHKAVIITYPQYETLKKIFNQ
jgi:imidazole glycerol-phosphate synthase subunit HisF